MFPDMTDVVIIGGGLAGLSAAILLGRQGKQVCLFESNRYPFHKVCGEYLSMESWPFLERLGVPLSSMQLPRIQHFRLTDHKGHQLSVPLHPGGFGISRYTLDHLLAGMATEARVTVRDGTRVDEVTWNGKDFSIRAGNDCLQTRVVLGTWGKRSNLDRQLNRSFFNRPDPRLNDWVGIKYHVASTFPEDRIKLHNFPGGYCGISRVNEGRTTLCYLVRGDRLLEAGGQIRQLETTVLYQNPILKNYFESFPSLYDTPKAISQVNFEPRPVIESHILLAGDSAGLIPPLTGNGMSMALRSSTLAVPLICSFLDGKSTREQLENSYRKQWKSTFGTRLATGRLVQSLFGDSRRTGPLITAGRMIPGLASGLIRLTHGQPF